MQCEERECSGEGDGHGSVIWEGEGCSVGRSVGGIHVRVWQNEVIRICLSCHRSHGCRTTTSCAPFGTSVCGCGQRKYRTVGNLREKTFANW